MMVEAMPELNGRGRLVRSPSTALTFVYEGNRFEGKFTRHPDGRVAEIYLAGGAIYNTKARLASLSLAAGVDIQTVRHAAIGGPLAVLIDLIMGIDR
jgi:hypothetical protein